MRASRWRPLLRRPGWRRRRGALSDRRRTFRQASKACALLQPQRHIDTDLPARREGRSTGVICRTEIGQHVHRFVAIVSKCCTSVRRRDPPRLDKTVEQVLERRFGFIAPLDDALRKKALCSFVRQANPFAEALSSIRHPQHAFVLRDQRDQDMTNRFIGAGFEIRRSLSESPDAL